MKNSSAAEARNTTPSSAPTVVREAVSILSTRAETIIQAIPTATNTHHMSVHRLIASHMSSRARASAA
jgi:hypothetical protein